MPEKTINFSAAIHSGLNFKEVRGRRNIWSARVGNHYRALCFRNDDEVVWFWIGTHEDYNNVQAIRS